jgi:uncharacterized repeat protein (TIGR03803 family)
MKTFTRSLLLFITALLPAFAQAQSYSDLYPFSEYSGYPPSNYDGAIPYCNLVLSNGVLYGTTWEGGTNGSGAIFSVHSDGTHFQPLYSFSPLSDGVVGYNSDGGGPYCTLVLSSNYLYGTASTGGTGGGGSIFRINIDGTGFTNLYNFGTYSGAPRAGLTISGNVLYGTTTTGGQDYGSVFRINTDGTHFTNLISFYPSPTNRAFSAASGLVLSGNMLYGMTDGGGPGIQGSIFAINTNGSGYTNLFFFQGVGGESQPSTNTTGGNPQCNLVLVGDMLYGTTQAGGTNGNGVIFGINTDGTGFTNLHTFSAQDPDTGTNYDGILPLCQLLAIGNTLYGTASAAGPSGFGTLYSINTDGSDFTVLWSFPSILGMAGGNYIDTDGVAPAAGVIVSGTTLYGTTADGGINGNVYAFDLSTNAPPPTLGFQANVGSFTLTWDASKYTLQVASFLGGGFTDVSGATSPDVVVPNLAAAFYRLRSN